MGASVIDGGTPDASVCMLGLGHADFVPNRGNGKEQCAITCPSVLAREDIRRTIETFYAALAKDDHVTVQRVTTPDFYAFEIGKKYSGKELSDLIAKSHAEGRIINWGLGPMSLQVDCSIASATWENVGSAGSTGKLQPRAWLESAVLRRHDDGWTLAFLHSTPKDPRE